MNKIQSRLHMSEPFVTESTERMLEFNETGTIHYVPLSTSCTEVGETHERLIQHLGSLTSTLQSRPPSLSRAKQYQLTTSVRKGDRDFRLWNRLPTMPEEDHSITESNRENDCITKLQNYRHPLLDECLSSSSRDSSPIQPQRQASLEQSESSDTQ